MASLFGTYTIKDAKGETSTMRVNFAPNGNIGQARAFLEATAPLIAAVITGQLVGIGLGIGVDLPGGLPTAPEAGSDVEEGARFSWRSAADFITSFRVPTFDEAFILAGTRQVDTADTAVDALIDRMLDGYTTGLENIQPTDERGSDITSLEAARESFTKSRT